MSAPSSPTQTPVPGASASLPPAAPAGGTAANGRSLPPARAGIVAAVLRAAADFTEAAGLGSGVHLICGDGEMRISVFEPSGDVARRCATVTHIAALIGGRARQHDNPDYAISDLRADGVIGGFRAAVKTTLPVRLAMADGRPGRPLAQAPSGHVTPVSGKLPRGWRWITALDVDPGSPAPRKPRKTPAKERAAGPAPGPSARGRLRR